MQSLFLFFFNLAVLVVLIQKSGVWIASPSMNKQYEIQMYCYLKRVMAHMAMMCYCFFSGELKII